MRDYSDNVRYTFRYRPISRIQLRRDNTSVFYARMKNASHSNCTSLRGLVAGIDEIYDNVIIA